MCFWPQKLGVDLNTGSSTNTRVNTVLTRYFYASKQFSASNIQPVTLNLSSPTVNSTRSGPLTGSTDYSDMSPRTDLTSPDSAASLYQRRAQQLTPGRDDTMLHYSPGGAVPKGTMSDSFSAVKASLWFLTHCLQEVIDTLIAKPCLLSILVIIVAAFLCLIIHLKIRIFNFLAF